LHSSAHFNKDQDTQNTLLSNQKRRAAAQHDQELMQRVMAQFAPNERSLI